MGMSGVALLSIDMQRAFGAGGWPPGWNSNLDKNGLTLLDSWRERGWPIFHVRHDSIEPDSTLSPNMPGNAFRDGFGPRGSETLIRKSVNAAFIGTDLDLRLRRLGIRTLVAFGISTDMCVSTTVRVGANLGYSMILVEDACDSFDLPTKNGGSIPAKAIHDAHVATLGYEFARVMTTEEVRETMAAAAPHF